MSHSEIGDPRFRTPDDFLTLPEEERLEIALRTAPRGAMALAGIAVAILMLAWLAIYIFVFIPRGVTG
jgi:hypothetical protein